jgi:hypothetical protein
MNSNKKFGLKKSTQIRDLSQFTKEELDEINKVKKDDSVDESKEEIEKFDDKKEVIKTS